MCCIAHTYVHKISFRCIAWCTKCCSGAPTCPPSQRTLSVSYSPSLFFAWLMEFTLAGPPTFNTRATIIIIITQKRTSYKKTQLKIDFVLFSGFCSVKSWLCHCCPLILWMMMQTCYNANSKFGKHFRFFKTVCQPRFATEPEKVLNRGRGGPGERGSGPLWQPLLAAIPPPRGPSLGFSWKTLFLARK